MPSSSGVCLFREPDAGNPPGFRFLILLGTSSDVIQELAWSAVQCLSNFHDVFEADIPLATLDTSHERSVNPSVICKGLLRDSSR